jgi:hypothetical protein
MLAYFLLSVFVMKNVNTGPIGNKESKNQPIEDKDKKIV